MEFIGMGISLIITVLGWAFIAGQYSNRIKNLEIAVKDQKEDQDQHTKDVTEIKISLARIETSLLDLRERIYEDKE